MRADIKQRWTAALRSGNYKQGRSVLRHPEQEGPDEFCCLGVLCELAVEDGVIDPPERRYTVYTYGAGENTAGLPQEVQDWAEYYTGLGWLDTEVDGNRYLSDLNDSNPNPDDPDDERQSYTFNDIADVIEEQL